MPDYSIGICTMQEDNPLLEVNEPAGVGGTRLPILREGNPPKACVSTWGGHAERPFMWIDTIYQ